MIVEYKMSNIFIFKIKIMNLIQKSLKSIFSIILK